METRQCLHESEIGKLVFFSHCAVTSVWGLLALRLASDDILPMKYETYANELQSYALLIVSRLSASNAPESISCAPLLSAITDLKASIQQLTQELKVRLHLCVDTEIYGEHAVVWDLLIRCPTRVVLEIT